MINRARAPIVYLFLQIHLHAINDLLGYKKQQKKSDVWQTTNNYKYRYYSSVKFNQLTIDSNDTFPPFFGKQDYIQWDRRTKVADFILITHVFLLSIQIVIWWTLANLMKFLHHFTNLLIHHLTYRDLKVNGTVDWILPILLAG